MSIPGLELRIKAGEAPDFRMVLLNKPENVSLVRHALGAIAEMAELSEDTQIDINAAVSEACNNVVLHAYGGEAGLLEVYVCPQDTELEVVVNDRGTGIQPRPVDQDVELQGVGLSLIQALTDRVEFHGGADEGTELRMVFALERPIDLGSDFGRESEHQVTPPPGETVVSVASGRLAAPVLGRVIAMIGARAGFSIEGIAEAQLVTDAIAAHAPEATVGRHVHVGMDSSPGSMTLRVGPLEAGGADRMVAASSLAGLPALLAQVPSASAVEQMDGGELLCLTLG